MEIHTTKGCEWCHMLTEDDGVGGEDLKVWMEFLLHQSTLITTRG